MAETETVAVETERTHGGARLGSGRKRTRTDEVNPETAAAAAAVDTAEEFFAYLKTFPADAWREELLLYLFRTGPLTDSRRTGNFKYIQKYSKPVDQEDIMRDFGSGGYRLYFNRYDPATRKTNLLREHNFDIQNIDFPPKVPAGEWIDDERNKEWAWAKPALLAQQNNAYAMNGMGGGMNVDPAAMFQAAVDAVGKLRPEANDDEKNSMAEKVIDLMQRNMDQTRAASDPTQMLSIVDKILTAVKPAGGESSTTTLLLTKMMEQNTTLLTKMLDQPKKSMIEELKDLKGISDELFGRRRNGPELPGKNAWDIAESLGTKVLDVASSIGQMYVMRMMGAQPNPAAPPLTSTAVVSAEPMPPMSEEDKTRMIKTISDQYGVFFDEVTPHLVDHFHNFDGVDFREWFCEEYGKNFYRTLRAYDPRTVIDVIELRKKVAPDEKIRAKLAELQPPEKLTQFIQEFLSDEPLEDDEPQPEGAQAAAPGDF